MPGIAALALAYVLSQFFRSFLAVLSPVLISELGATKIDLALASGAFFLTFGLMQFAVGVALDHYGPRRTASLHFRRLRRGRGIRLRRSAGAGTTDLRHGADRHCLRAGADGVLLHLSPATFPVSRFAIMTSWLVAFGMLGNVISASPLAAAAEAFGWRGVMAGLGVVQHGTGRRRVFPC